MNPLLSSTPETTATLVNYSAPMHLKHRPIFMIPYAPFDGPYEETDAKYISLGLAQWRNPDDPYAISAKVWRYVDRKWSRMSEELPLHRLVDLCLFVSRCVFGVSDRATVEFRVGTFAEQASAMEARRLEPFPEAFGEEKNRLRERLRALRDALNELEL